jgi:molybdate transport system ATP-binding protein
MMDADPPRLPILEVDLHFQRGPLVLAAKFLLTAPWTCLFGASGSGKTTILRAIAGFDRPQSGRIRLFRRPGARRQDDCLWCDAGGGVWLPPHRRPVRIAAQQSWLFPGTVSSNIGYAVARQNLARAVDFALNLLHLRALANKDVRQLSGGERRRVHLARAVAAAIYGDEPASLLLLDEPFTGLDAALATELAASLRDRLRECALPVLSVTHDVAEVFTLDAEVLRLQDGKIVAQGAAAEVLAPERMRLRTILRDS